MRQTRRVGLTYIHCKIASEKLLSNKGTQLVLCDNVEGWDGGVRREAQEGGDRCVHIDDSLHCTAETNVTL